MFMRHSTLGIREDFDVGLNIVAYKCPMCDWFILFEVRDDKDYIMKVFEKYRGEEKKLIPVDMWLSDDETGIIEQKLADLGYV
jgi:hypothetical protein